MMKICRDMDDWTEESGPWPKAKRTSLKLASHVMKNEATTEVKKTEGRYGGRIVKRYNMGRREISLKKPFGILEEME